MSYYGVSFLKHILQKLSVPDLVGVFFLKELNNYGYKLINRSIWSLTFTQRNSTYVRTQESFLITSGINETQSFCLSLSSGFRRPE